MEDQGRDVSTTNSGVFTPDYVVVQIDGNSIMAAAVSVTPGGRGQVHGVRTIELPALVHRVVRRRHPIHMDVSCLEYSDSRKIQAAIEKIVSEPLFRDRRLVGVFMPDVAVHQSATGPATADARRERRRRLIRSVQHANPIWYPSIFSIHEETLPDGQERIRIWNARLADVVATATQFERTGQKFAGMVVGMRAGEEVLSLLDEADRQRTVSLVNIGKLHTLYLGGRSGTALFGHAIPVGLARDDVHYFESMAPCMDGVRRLHRAQGAVLLPPDATPSPLFDPRRSTPQLDMTRFASQVARFACRTLQEDWIPHGGSEGVQHYLTGHASRVPGLREYFDQKTGLKFRRFDRRPITGLRLSPGVDWPDVADHLLLIGAGMAYIRRSQDNFGLIRRSNRPIKLTDQVIRVDDIRPGKLYIHDTPCEVV